MAKQHDTYLGDGAYADYDGLAFTITAPRDGGEHWVYLEPQVLEAFLRYAGEKLGGTFTFRAAPRAKAEGA